MIWTNIAWLALGWSLILLGIMIVPPAVAPGIGLFYLRIGHHPSQKQNSPTSFELGRQEMPLGCRPST